MWRGIARAGVSVFLSLGLALPGIAAAADLGDEPGLSDELPLPFSRALSVSGVVTGALGDSLATDDVPAPAVAETIRAFATVIDLDRDVKTGDRFHLRYEQQFTQADEPTGAGRLMWAELKTAAKGTIVLHRFHPLQGPEQFWLASGKAAAPPVVGQPLDVMTLTSGFGLRTDPLDHPPGPLAGLATPPPPPSPPPKAGPTAEQKAAEVRDRREVARAYAGFDFGGGGQLGSATDRFRNPELDRIMAENRIRARREREDAERARQEGTALAAARAAAPPPVVEQPPPKLYMHEGLDLLANSGTPVHAAADGTVIGAGPNGGYGNWIRLRHGDRLTTVYGHLSGFAPGLEKGAVVSRGEVIGFVGSTGRATGAHLHFELLVAGQPVDPRTHPATKPAQLAGADLERLRKQVAASLAERDHETAAATPTLTAQSRLPAGDFGCGAF